MTRILALVAVILAAAWLAVQWAFRALGNPRKQHRPFHDDWDDPAMDVYDDAISYAGGSY